VTTLLLAPRSTLHAQLFVARTITQRTFTSARASPKPKPTSFTFSSHPRMPSTILQRLRSSIRFFHNSRPRQNVKPTSPDPTPNLNSPKGTSSGAAEAEPQGLGAKMRKLSREYGWSALGVYFALTALDFPFCYLFVKQMGTDRIGELGYSSKVILKVPPVGLKEGWNFGSVIR
jgi:N-terminal acetyltransferase 2